MEVRNDSHVPQDMSSINERAVCRYLEKVVPSPYGPRLPWNFPFSRSFWLSGDVTQGPGVMPMLKGLLYKLPWRNSDAQAYEQVQDLPILC